MKRFLTVEDVVSDIEFELLQAAISQDEISHSIQLVRTHLDKLRTGYFSSGPKRDPDTLVARQFQLTDMLLTLLEELTARYLETQSELRQLGDLAFAGLPAEELARGRRLLLDMWSTSELDDLFDSWPPKDIQEAMHPDTLRPKLVLRPPHTPLIGGLVNRLRTALHMISLFYVGRLAQRQTKINAVYGNWIGKIASNVHEQREMLRILTEKVELLERDLSLGADR